jgi:hypothetical protein
MYEYYRDGRLQTSGCRNAEASQLTVDKAAAAETGQLINNILRFTGA